MKHLSTIILVIGTCLVTAMVNGIHIPSFISYAFFITAVISLIQTLLSKGHQEQDDVSKQMTNEDLLYKTLPLFTILGFIYLAGSAMAGKSIPPERWLFQFALLLIPLGIWLFKSRGG